MQPTDPKVDQIARMLWHFDGFPDIPEEHREAEREAYRNRAVALINRIREEEHRDVTH